MQEWLELTSYVEAEDRKTKQNKKKERKEEEMENGGGRSRNDVYGCWLFSSDCGSYHGNLINRCPTYQQGIRLHSSVNKHTLINSSRRVVRTRTDRGKGDE